MTAGGVVEDAVLDAVLRIARGEDGGGDGRALDAGDVGGGIGVDGLADIDAGGQHVGPDVGGGAGEDAVIIGGEPLGFHERFAAAIGAAIEIGVLRGLAVERLDEALGVDGGEVQGAIAEVIDFFGMMVGPACIFAVGFVAGVGAGGGIAALEVCTHGGEADGAGESAVADAQEFAVPVGGGQPDFEADVGVRGGLDDAGHAAEGGEFVDGVAVGRGERARGDGLGGSDGGVREGHGGEAFTGGGGRKGYAGHGGQEGEDG